MINRIKLFIVPFFIFISTGYTVVYAQQDIPGMNTIQSSDLISTVTFLASPELDGRQPGSDGYYKAAKYMMDKFVAIGLKPVDGKSYYQDVPVEFCHITGNPEFSVIQNDGKIKKYRLGQDFVCRGQTGFGDVQGEVVFCGYGISEPSLGYDDYANIDVKGKIAMVFKQNPKWEIKGFEAGDKYNRYRANVAAAHGALAVILVSTPLAADPQKPIGSIMDGSGTYDIKFPQIHIDIPVAEELLQSAGKMSLKDLQRTIDTLKSPISQPLAVTAHIKIQGEYFKDKKSMNVLALLPGSDPLLSKEYIVVSAHLDHVGRQGDNFYFPGANDNASGSAAVMQIANAFVKGGVKPKRSIIFALYTSEEQGLFGSKYFADYCPVPKENIVAAMNLDCVGFGDSIQVGAGKANPKLWDIAWKLDSLTSKLMSKNTWQGGGADLEALYQNGIPGLYFVTRNSYAHLHLPSDKPETLNKELYEKLVKLAYGVVYKVAMGDYTKEQVQKK
jgi:aminopeptidase YwaD